MVLPPAFVAAQLINAVQAYILLRHDVLKIGSDQHPTLEEVTAHAPYGSPRILRWYRTSVCAYVLGLSIWQLGRSPAARFTELCPWFTMWSWYLLVLYFVLATIASWTTRYMDRPPSPRAGDDHRRPGLWLPRAILVLYHVHQAMVWLLLVITWGILYPAALAMPDPRERRDKLENMLNFGSYNQHGGNVVFMLGELFLAHLPFQSRYLGWVGVWTALYFLFESFSKIVWDQFHYPIFEGGAMQQWSAALLIPALQWASFGLVLALVSRKKKLVERVESQRSIASNGGADRPTAKPHAA
ncbi:hypothetical protein ACKKBF_B17330 [Auxenochlorella protothecoides x Auxenochlorella symbiontica]